MNGLASMFKNILIVILTISTAMFAYIAIRNSTPLECSEVIQIEENNLCIINLKKLTPYQLEQAIDQIQSERYKYINE